MWVRFEKIHRHRFSGRSTRRYMPGEVRNVPKVVAEKAVAAGNAVAVKAPRRGQKPGTDHGA